MPSTSPDRFLLPSHGWVPNNPHHPVLHYHGVAEDAPDRAAAMEALFRRNHWPAQWRNGIYPFHHFHSTAHEVLGIAAGHARVKLGGEGGREVDLNAGDVVILPAGTGHCRLSASPDFLVVGGYPEGQDWDTCRSGLTPAQLKQMLALDYPRSNPVNGIQP